ncbi:hypothetical protein PG997_013314 [Apiospora hydei]|uniref:F-box domain-containing protein n=1 Tax=Apiospora hydei TaxID=1337664 RepID=A0ABR1V5V0_9PEZI
MATTFLSSSGPTELLVLVLRSCDSIADVLAFGDTCRYLRSVLRSNTSTILRDVGAGSVVCFDEALVAPTRNKVRAIQICIDAEHQEQLPPADLQLDDISAQPLSLEELPRILDLDHCVHALEVSIRHKDDFDLHENCLPESPEGMPEWSTRLRKAIYRSFVLGAALSRAYRDPFFDDTEKWRGMEEQDYSREDYRYLEGFAAYSMQPTPEAEHATFGPVADWLVGRILSDDAGRRAHSSAFEQKEGRAACCNDLIDPESWDSDADRPCPLPKRESCQHSDSHFIAWEVMQVLWVSCHIQSWPAYSRACCDTSPVDRSRHEEEGEPQDLDPDPQTYPRKAHVVLFGHFSPEELRIPGIILDDRKPKYDEPKILARPAVRKSAPSASGADDQQRVFYSEAGFDDFLGFLGSVERLQQRRQAKHGFRFRDGVFDDDDPGFEVRADFHEFLMRNAIVANNEECQNDACYAEGSGFLVGLDPLPELIHGTWYWGTR